MLLKLTVSRNSCVLVGDYLVMDGINLCRHLILSLDHVDLVNRFRTLSSTASCNSWIDVAVRPTITDFVINFSIDLRNSRIWSWYTLVIDLFVPIFSISCLARYFCKRYQFMNSDRHINQPLVTKKFKSLKFSSSSSPRPYTVYPVNQSTSTARLLVPIAISADG